MLLCEWFVADEALPLCTVGFPSEKKTIYVLSPSVLVLAILLASKRAKSQFVLPADTTLFNVLLMLSVLVPLNQPFAVALPGTIYFEYVENVINDNSIISFILFELLF